MTKIAGVCKFEQQQQQQKGDFSSYLVPSIFPHEEDSQTCEESVFIY